MDERVLVEVYVPAALLTFTMYLPCYHLISDIQEALFPVLEEMTNGAFTGTLQTMLYSQRLHTPLNKSVFLKDTGIQYADRILVL